MTHSLPMQVDQSCTVIFSQASKGKVLEWCHSGLNLNWKQRPGKEDFLRLSRRRLRCSKTMKVEDPIIHTGVSGEYQKKM